MISLVIPAYGDCPHLLDVLAAVFESAEVPDEVIVSHSGEANPADEINARFPSVTVLHSSDRLFAGAARNRGAAAASGGVLIFCDADTVPQTGWMKALVNCVTASPSRVVVGAVGVARSGGYWGMSNWLLEFSEQAPWRRSGAQSGGASCNMGVRAEDFHAIGGFSEDYRISEDTKLLASLRERGLEQILEPKALVSHFNHSGLPAFVEHQLGLGKGFADLRFREQMKGSFAVRMPFLALALFAPKAFVVMRRTLVAGWKPFLTGIYLLPGVILGSIIWSWGCFRHARHLRKMLKPQTS